jgi:NAD(P)-dependent dehydrogenase (short-subunit alcohol dehydrogenase family)
VAPIVREHRPSDRVRLSLRRSVHDREQGGSIILTGSFLAGIGAATAQMAFSASKAAVVQIGRDLGIHLARSGIRVNTLSLGPVETPELRRMFDHIGPEQVARRMSRVPLGRPATLDEVAAAVAYLASDDSGYLTGSVFPVDGGIPAAYTIPGQ